MSGGERAQLMMKQGRAGVRAHRTFFIAGTTCACTRHGGEGGGVRVGKGGGHSRCTSPEEESHSKHSQMIKGFWANLQHLTSRLMEKINCLYFDCRAAAAVLRRTRGFFFFLTYMSFKTRHQEPLEAKEFQREWSKFETYTI